MYGGKSIFGGRETPLEASVISCDKFESCSFYKSGHCLKVRSFGSAGCKFGQVNNVRGYTSRAKKYGEFKRKWDGHEKRGKLSYPPTKLGLIDDYIVFPYPYVRIVDDGELLVKDPSFARGETFIQLHRFTNELIYRICKFKPQAMMGGTITDYQKKTVPLFLAHLKEVLPERYESFVRDYPEFGEKEINYVGRRALLNTIKPSYVYYKSERYPKFDEKWYWDGEHLKYDSGYVERFNIAKKFDVVEIKIKPHEDTEITISDNEQVDTNTILID